MSGVAPVVRVHDTPQGATRAALEAIIQWVRERLQRQERLTVALSGGHTPKPLYEALAEQKLAFERIHFLFVDERYVPHDHPDSNFGMVNKALFQRAPIPKNHIHAVPTELSPATACASRYEQELRTLFKGQLPNIDVMVMGLGPEGHTASLFPGSPALKEQSWVSAPWVDKLKSHRITLTPPVINASHRVLFLVEGEEKAEAVKETLEGDAPPERVPARVVQPLSGKIWWFLDKAAAQQLKSV